MLRKKFFQSLHTVEFSVRIGRLRHTVRVDKELVSFFQRKRILPIFDAVDGRKRRLLFHRSDLFDRPVLMKHQRYLVPCIAVFRIACRKIDHRNPCRYKQHLVVVFGKLVVGILQDILHGFLCLEVIL